MARTKKPKVIKLIIEQSEEPIDMVNFISEVLEYKDVKLHKGDINGVNKGPSEK